jgi:hypothetical protein
MCFAPIIQPNGNSREVGHEKERERSECAVQKDLLERFVVALSCFDA